jgi:hypothetical protein
MHHVETLETELGVPAMEVRPRIIERIAEFDEHVQRHEQTKGILAAGIVNEGFNDDECAAGREGVVSRADVVHFFPGRQPLRWIIRVHDPKNLVNFRTRRRRS